MMSKILPRISKIMLIPLLVVLLISILPNSYSEKSQNIPEWIKNISGWWADDLIDDETFIQGLEFLIQNEIIHVSSNSYSEKSQNIPEWIKNTAGLWAIDKISETEFIQAIEFMINTKILMIDNTDENYLSTLLISWDEIIRDTKYANDGSLKIQNDTFGNLDNMLSMRYDANENSSFDQTTFDLLNSGIVLFQITGNEIYLDQARSVANTIETKLLSEDGRVWISAPQRELYFTADNQELLLDVALLSFYDSNYKKLTKIIADGILKNEINNKTNLIHSFFLETGEPYSLEMYMSYGGSVGLESLLLAYEVTGEKKYLDQVKQTIMAYWELRNIETNLIPSSVNTNDLYVEKKFMQQYGAGIFLKVLLHYYYLTDDPEIFIIMKDYSDSVIEHFWDGKTWNYRVNFDGTVLSNVIEGNYAKLDDALILLHDLNSTVFDTSFKYAKIDYDNSFQNSIAVTNDLVIHAVQDDGSKQSTESMMQYAFLINQNVGSRLFHETLNPEYLKTLQEFYHSIILNHKRELGYITGIDAYTLKNTETGVLLNQRASGMISNKINLTFIPLDNVQIIWMKIGNYEITEPFITTFLDHGRFNSIDFDYENKSIFFHTVYNSGQIIFSDEILSVLVDGEDFHNFNSHTLNTLDGKHSYRVFLQ